MRMSQLFSRTLRPTGKDEIASAEYLVRAGFIRQLASGIFSYLPIAQRSINKIENIIRDEMDKIGCQEITMPVVNPADIWKDTNRYHEIDQELTKFNDRGGRDMVLAMTHEEIATSLIRSEIQSYKQLPVSIYQIQTKWRDDARPRAGLIRVREFTMKDSYSAAATWEQLDEQYADHFHAYFKIFNRCSLPVIAVSSDLGMMGGKMAHEYMYLNPIGEDTLILCKECGYTANRQIAEFKKTLRAEEAETSLTEVETPDTESIEDLCKFLGVTADQTMKAVFFMGKFQDGEEETEKLVFAQIRGDLSVNETKIANAVKAKELRPAHVEEIEAIGSVAGYASAVGIKDVLVINDNSIQEGVNYIGGANKAGYHLTGVRPGRDFKADITADIAAADEGHNCTGCGKPLTSSRGVEVGNIFKLGTKYSEALGAVFNDPNGKEVPVIMGSYGIGVGRLLACIVEEHHDDNGIIWPMSVAPYQVHLIDLSKKSSKAEELYKELTDLGLEVLFDDRKKERAGVKFKDADLMGIPLRITVGDKALEEGKVEYKTRNGNEDDRLPLEGLTDFIKNKVQECLKAETLGVEGVLIQ